MVKEAYEVQIDQVIARLCGGLAQTLEARATDQPAVGTQTGTPGRGQRAGDAGPGQDSRGSTRLTGSLPQPGWNHEAGADLFRRGHYPDRKNSSSRAGGQRPLESTDEDAGPAHGGTGGVWPSLETGNRPARGRGGSPQEKRETSRRFIGAVTPSPGPFAADDPPDSGGAGG